MPIGEVYVLNGGKQTNETISNKSVKYVYSVYGVLL